MQIQKVNFVKVEYDKPFSHDIKAIAKIYASDHIIIDGVLLYTPSGSNEDEDYFDAHNQYWGNFENIWVKYPKTCSIENEVKRNFAYEIIDQYWKFLFTLELQQKNAELLELTEEQWKESSKSLEVYWLDKYIDKIDISIACKENPNITEEFIRKYLHKIDFLALGENFSVLRCYLVNLSGSLDISYT